MKSCLSTFLLNLLLRFSASVPPIDEQKIRVDGVSELTEQQGPVELKWGPLNVLSTTEKVGICERVLESDENHSLSQCVATAHAVVLRHRPLLGLLTGQLQEVCEHLKQYLGRVSTLAKSNKGTTAKVCEEISDDESKAEEDGQIATCAAVQRLLSKGVTLDSVCNRLSLSKTCLDDLKKSSHLRGRKACDLGLSDDASTRETPAHHFLRVCAATASKIHSQSLIHTLTTVQKNGLLFFNPRDNAVISECSKQLSGTDSAVSICWDMVASFVESRSAHSTSTPAARRQGPFDIPAFCQQYAAWLIEQKNTEGKDTAQEKTMTSSVRAAPIQPIRLDAASSTGGPDSKGIAQPSPPVAGTQQLVQHFPGMPQVPLQVPQAPPLPAIPELPVSPLHIPQVPSPPRLPPAPHVMGEIAHMAPAAAAGHVPAAPAPVVPPVAAAAPPSSVPGGVPHQAASPDEPKAVSSAVSPQAAHVLPKVQAVEPHGAPPTAAVQGAHAPAAPKGATVQPSEASRTPAQNTTMSAVLVTNAGQRHQSGAQGQQQQPPAVVTSLTPPQNVTSSAVIVSNSTSASAGAVNNSTGAGSAKAKDDKDDVDDVDATKSDNVDIKVVEAKLKVAKENADMMIKSEHLAKVVADKITEKAVTMKQDAEAIEKTEKVAKKEADIIAQNAAIAKAAADAISKKAHDAQVDAQRIAQKAMEANKDAIKIEIKAIDAKRDATVIMQKAQIADKNAAKVAKKATEAATKASKWENKVTEVKTERVKKEYIPMSSWA